MALKFRMKSKDEVPAELQAHYLERDGAWVLAAEGVAERGTAPGGKYEWRPTVSEFWPP